MTNAVEKKMTKRECLETLSELLNNTDPNHFPDMEFSTLADFVENEIALLDRRAEKAKERAKNKKAEEDPIMERVVEILKDSDHAMTIADILAEMPEDMELTTNKIAYRAGRLGREGLVNKDTVSIKEEGKPARRVTAYTWVTGPTEEE